MFWIGFVVGVISAIIILFELGRYLEKREGEKEIKRLKTDNG